MRYIMTIAILLIIITTGCSKTIPTTSGINSPEKNEIQVVTEKPQQQDDKQNTAEPTSSDVVLDLQQYDMLPLSVVDAPDENMVVWHDPSQEAFPEEMPNGVTIYYGSIRDLIDSGDEGMYYAMTISYYTYIDPKAIREFYIYDGKTYSELEDEYSSNQYIKMYNEEFEDWCKNVYPTLPIETFGNDTPKVWWTMNCWSKHSKEIIEGYYNAKQAEYEQFTSKYKEWIQQYSKDCASKIYANQAELLRRQGIYVAKEFDNSCEVYITVEQLKNLVNPENCSYGVWWTIPNS